jgi:hypothetical protein
MFFTTPSSIPARHVACRLSMVVGISGPLAWEKPEDPCAPTLPCIAGMADGSQVWNLGAEFTLTEFGECGTGFHKYQLTHPKLTHELEGLQQFLEYVFDQIGGQAY